MMDDATEVPIASDALSVPPPNFDADEAAELARQLFDVEGDVTPLGSERDQNFSIDGTRGRYVLRIANRADDPSVLEMQTEAMLHAARRDPSLPLQSPVRARDGRYIVGAATPHGARHFVRLLTWVDGQDVEAVDLPFDSLEPIGACAARVARSLRGFFHPAARRHLFWDLRHVGGLGRLLSNVRDPGRRQLVAAAIDRYDKHVAAAFDGLRAQIIHNDLSLGNVLVDSDGRVTGIVDFGDMTHTALVGELVATMTSLMRGRADPFETADAAVAGFSTVTPLEPEERIFLPDLIAGRLAITVIVSAWRARKYPENETYITGWDRDSWELLDLFERLGDKEVRRRFMNGRSVLRLAGSGVRRRDEVTSHEGRELDGLLERRRRVLGGNLAPLSYSRPLHLVRAQGSWVFDARGRRYLDAYNNVPVVGHCHPYVVDAIAQQTGTLNTNIRYLHENAVELAERLTASMPDPLDTCMFVNSGSEANDLAWRLATAATAGSGAIVTAYAYHGVSSAVHDFSPEDWGTNERPEHVETIPAPDGFRGRYHRRQEQESARRYAEHVQDAGGILHSRDRSLAMTLVDSGLASDGILAAPAQWFADVVRHTHDAGGLYVADEVQIGFGRTGSHLWGFSSAGIVPDIVTVGKPMGNGYPVAAVVTSSAIVERFARNHEFFSTFGGNPVACAAALAVLDVIENEGLVANAASVGHRLRAGIHKLATRHPLIGDVRGMGLLIGVELVGDPSTRAPASRQTATLVDAMRGRGVLIGSTGPDGNVLKIRPPLVFGNEEADLLLETLEDALGELR